MIGDPKETGERGSTRARSSAAWVERIRAPGRARSWTSTVAERGDRRQQLRLDRRAVDASTSCATSASTSRSTGCSAARSVRARLEAGISYTEFSYVLLQSMDYLELSGGYGCTLQTGGSDQWGNITAGVELIRRVEGGKVHALATPLITKADGTKFGKTEAGTIWLDPEMTSPYAFYQFWLNADDRDVVELLRYFTFRCRDGDRGARASDGRAARPREAQRALAEDVTTLVHGAEETERGAGGIRGAVRRRGPRRRSTADTLDAACARRRTPWSTGRDELPTSSTCWSQPGWSASKGGGPADGRRGRRVPQQRAVDRRRGVPTDGRSAARAVAGAAAGEADRGWGRVVPGLTHVVD